MKDDSLNVFTFGYWPARNVIHNIKQFFRNIKYGWQRATKGYCDWDLWDLDQFHLALLEKALIAFKKSNNGYPNGLTEESWDKILDRMIYCYHMAYEYLYNTDKYNEFYEPWSDSVDHSGMKKNEFVINDNEELRNKMIERNNEIINQGIEYATEANNLMTKYERDLWY